ncbi:HipA N-terminal domain-containing protein [Hymenobacter lapidiphilus]|uniref:HipA N-terminal domain-containing protein n=1 Tax=Hymenobacter lapidiphilus TaxID=2608003 RepID=A0A7Y7PS10_9BACT|nr:HipA N-terminal domain-containing protein [Hymenobacter lapidiphilus]NVO32980.1 HipA N-terminal domain-containing protein [Hymenobacter lapidiphilus]
MKTISAQVLDNDRLVGLLSREPDKYVFRYDDAYLQAAGPAISLSLPTTRQTYISNYLFPFFSGLLAEGTNKSLQTRQLHLDENDDFSRLLLTAHTQTIGAITVREVPNHD